MNRSIIQSTEQPGEGNFRSQAPFELNVMVAAKGGGITFVGKLFTYASRLIISFLLARQLGAEQYGLYNLALTAATIASGLALLGLEDAMLRYVPLYATRRDEAGLWGSLQIALGLSAVVSVLISLTLFVLAAPIATHLFHEPALASLLHLVSLIVPFLTVSAVAASATRGFKTMQYATVAQDILQPLIRLLLVIVLAVVGLTAGLAVAIYGIAVGVATLLLLWFLHRLFPLVRPLRAGRYDGRELVSFSAPVYVSGLISMFEGNLQTVLLGVLNTVTSVGVFALARQLTMLGHMFQSAVTTASKPILSELYERREWPQLGRMYQTTGKWMFAVNLPLFLMLALFPDPILALFGRSFVAGAPALVLMAAAILADVSTGMCGAVLDMTGRTRLKLFNSVVRTVLTIGLNLLLIPRWGIVGAAIASLVSVATVNLLRLIQVYVLYRLLPYNASFLKPLLAGAGATALLLLLRTAQGVDNPGVLLLLLQVAALFVTYIGLLLLLRLSDEDRLVLARVRGRMKTLRSKRRRRDH